MNEPKALPLEPSTNNPGAFSGNAPPGALAIQNPENPVNLDGYTIVDGVAQGGPDNSNQPTQGDMIMDTTANTAPATDPAKTLEAAELALVVSPLNKMLTDLQQPGANAETAVQEFGKLQLSLLQNAPGAESVGINGVAALLQAKLNKLVSGLAAPTAA